MNTKTLSKLIRYNNTHDPSRNIIMEKTARICQCGSCLCCRVDKVLNRYKRVIRKRH